MDILYGAPAALAVIGSMYIGSRFLSNPHGAKFAFKHKMKPVKPLQATLSEVTEGPVDIELEIILTEELALALTKQVNSHLYAVGSDSDSVFVLRRGVEHDVLFRINLHKVNQSNFDEVINVAKQKLAHELNIC